MPRKRDKSADQPSETVTLRWLGRPLEHIDNLQPNGHMPYRPDVPREEAEALVAEHPGWFAIVGEDAPPPPEPDEPEPVEPEPAPVMQLDPRTGFLVPEPLPEQEPTAPAE